MTVLYCKETPELKLGPGPVSHPSTIIFKNGWAEIPDGDERIQWVFAPGTPFIEIIDEEGRVAAGAESFDCEVCGASYDSKKRLNGHRLSHRG